MRRKKLFSSLAAVMVTASLAPAAFVVNEVDSDTPGSDAAEFVELKGDPNTSVDGMVLVFFGAGTGSNRSHDPIELKGKTDANGFFLIGDADVAGVDMVTTAGTIQNGEDAVALYTGKASDFPDGTLPTATNLIDVVIYEANAQTNRTWTGFGLSSVTVFNEGKYGLVTERSLSRLSAGINAGFEPTIPTPKADNVALADAIVSITGNQDFRRFNSVNCQVPTTRTITLKNMGKGNMNVSSFALDPSTSSVFTIVQGPDPAISVPLANNQGTSVVVQFVNSDLSASQVYGGAVNYATDAATSASGSVGLAAEFVKVAQTAQAGEVKINEVCYNPSADYNGDGVVGTNQYDEFIELINMTDQPINIQGWESKCTDADTGSFNSFTFPLGATLPANGFVVLFSGGTPTGFAPGTAFTYYDAARIRNTGAYVGISDCTTLIDGITYLGGEDTPDADGYLNTGVSKSGGSIGRRPDGSSTFMAFDPAASAPANRPTPGASNNGSAAASNWSLFE